MNRSYFLLPCMLLFCAVSFGQPMWSPEMRADRATAWMRDSANATRAQALKIKRIELNYHKQMDKLTDKLGQPALELMRRKDASMKAVLNKQQYQKYYRREQQIRDAEKNKKIDPEFKPR